MSRTTLRTTIAICALAVTTAAASGQTPGFYLVGLAPATTYSGVSALSQDGQLAVGGSVPQFTLGPSPAFRWTAATGRYDFGLEPGMPRATSARGVSSAGEVIVGYMADPTPDRAYRRVGNGPLENLGVLPGPYTRSYASAVSGDGNIVVGRSEYNPSSTSLVTQAVRWTPQTGMQGLGWLHPFDSRSEATAISRDGSMIVGISNNHGFVWREATGMQGLPVLPGSPTTQSYAYAVSGDGSAIIGASRATDGFYHAVRWTSSGVEDLGLLPGSVSGLPYAVSDDGMIVGGASDIAPGQQIATVWISGTGAMPLAYHLALHSIEVPIDWQLRSIYAISGDGLTFAGEARSTTGVRQGFVATIPAPSGMLVVFSSALLVMRRRRRGMPRVPPMGASVPEIGS
jgi:uncharacterized membrane protein